MVPNKIIFFDGVCHLCNGFVDWMIQKDQSRHFKFAPLQGETAKKYLEPQLIADLNSVVVYYDGEVFTEAKAIFKCFSDLPFPWKALSFLSFFPASILNFFYRIIARHRYQWFGQMDACRIPLPEERAYLLD
jgi:predicted DCC family thiol-disulfide oxidoreductase YuxK